MRQRVQHTFSAATQIRYAYLTETIGPMFSDWTATQVGRTKSHFREFVQDEELVFLFSLHIVHRLIMCCSCRVLCHRQHSKTRNSFDDEMIGRECTNDAAQKLNKRKNEAKNVVAVG